MTSEDLPNRVSRPRDCVFAVGIPTSEPGYRQSLQAPGERFAKRHGTFSQYWHQIVHPFHLLTERVTRLGVRLVRDLTLAEIGSLCSDERVHVLILFSHW